MRERLNCLGISYSETQLRDIFRKFWCVELFTLLGIKLKFDIGTDVDGLKLQLSDKIQKVDRLDGINPNMRQAIHFRLSMLMSCVDGWKEQLVSFVKTCRKERVMLFGKKEDLKDVHKDVHTNEVLVNMYVESILQYAEEMEVWQYIRKEDVYIQEYIFGGILDGKHILPFTFTLKELRRTMRSFLNAVNKENVYSSLLKHPTLKITDENMEKHIKKVCDLTIKVWHKKSDTIDNVIDECMTRHDIDDHTRNLVKEKVYESINKYYIPSDDGSIQADYLKNCRNLDMVLDECRKTLTRPAEDTDVIVWILVDENIVKKNRLTDLELNELKSVDIIREEQAIIADPLHSGGFILKENYNTKYEESGEIKKSSMPMNITFGELNKYFVKYKVFKPMKCYFKYKTLLFVPRFNVDNFTPDETLKHLSTFDPEVGKFVSKLCENIPDDERTPEQRNFCSMLSNKFSSSDNIKTLYGYTCVIEELIYCRFMRPLEEFEASLKTPDLAEEYKSKLMTCGDKVWLAIGLSICTGTTMWTLTPITWKLERIQDITENEHAGNAIKWVGAITVNAFEAGIHWYDEKMTEAINTVTGAHLTEAMVHTIGNTLVLGAAAFSVLNIVRHSNVKRTKVKCDMILRQIVDSDGKVPFHVMQEIRRYIADGKGWQAWLKGNAWYGDR
jgi:hypothetical protein